MKRHDPLRGTSQYDQSQIDAIYKEPIFSEVLPKHEEKVLPANYSTDEGWIAWSYYTNDADGAADQYLWSLSVGTDFNNLVAGRIDADKTPNPPNMFINMRIDTINQGNLDCEFTVQDKRIRSGIMVWSDDGTVYTIMDGVYEELTGTDYNNFVPDTFWIGSRYGLTPLDGQILYFEMGNEYLTKSQAAARVANFSNTLSIATAGQSNIRNWFDGVETDTSSGRDGFTSKMGANDSANCPGLVTLVDSAEGGSTIFKEVNPLEYWVTDEGTPGNEMLEFFEKQELMGVHPKLILWDQGEGESHYIGDPSGPYPWLTREVYKARLQLVFELFRSRYPGVHIFIGILGIRDSFTNPNAGIQDIVEIQHELIDELDYVHFGWNRFDLQVYTDGVHYYDASYATMGNRASNRVQEYLGYLVTGGSYGPKMVSATRSSTTVTVTLEHDGGTDFTPTTGIEGFYFTDDDVEINITAAVRASATTITLTLASTPTGTEKLYYMYNNTSVNIANLVKDNSANSLPLHRGAAIEVT